MWMFICYISVSSEYGLKLSKQSLRPFFFLEAQLVRSHAVWNELIIKEIWEELAIVAWSITECYDEIFMEPITIFLSFLPDYIITRINFDRRQVYFK